MDHTAQDTNHNLLTVILTTIAFISEGMRHLINNYDDVFKIMTLSVLALGIVVNLDKAVKVIWRYVVAIYQWIKKS